jgi:oligopeptide transport system substrate-binding protein
MKSITKILAASLIGTTFLVAPAIAANVPAGVELAADQTFTYRVLDEHSSVDPQIVEDVTGSEVVRDLFEGLLNQDGDGNLIPGVAQSWEASEGNTVYTFNLRKDAKWSNGEPVTANDFVYSWKRLANPETASPYAWFMEIMSVVNAAEIIAGEKGVDELGISAPDDHTLVVKLSAPLPYFAAMTTHGSTFPSPQKVVEEFGAKWTSPENIVSNGAYVLTEHVPGERSVRERNPMYWNDSETVINKVVALVINSDDQALIRYQAGELDRTEVPAGQYPALKKEFPNQAISFPRLCSYYYTFNLSDSGPEAFKDVRVRQALAYSLDRSVVTEQVLKGGQFEAFTFTPGATANFNVPDVDWAKLSQSERDAKAKELFAEAGYGKDNPLSFTLLYNTSEDHKKIATVAAQMWKQKLGINVTLANQEWKVFLETRGGQDFDLARGAWCGDYNEASTMLDLLTTPSGYNDGKYSNAEVDKLMTDAKMAADPSGNYTRVEEILAVEMPVVPVYHYTGVYMLNESIIGSWPVGNVEQNWYSRDLYKVK